MSSAPGLEAGLARTAKAITDLDGVVSLTLGGLSRAKPWQRKLADALADVDRLMEVLRMTISMECNNSEILAAADALAAGCRRVAGVVTGSRADLVTLTALRLATDLAERIQAELRRQKSSAEVQAERT